MPQLDLAMVGIKRSVLQFKLIHLISKNNFYIYIQTYYAKFFINPTDFVPNRFILI